MDIDPTKAPRTYAAWKKAYDVQELAKFMVELSQQLECELNESNKIIRQQQLLDEENLMLKERIKRLEDWKQSALAVEREWDANTVATMLGAKLGESQRKVIQREVPLLFERIKRLDEIGSELRDCASRIGTVASSEGSIIRRTKDAIKAWDKEEKP